MKLLSILILLIITSSCSGKLDKSDLHDQIMTAYDKAKCFYRCNKPDSAEYYGHIGDSLYYLKHGPQQADPSINNCNCD